ncbi:MAG: glycine cleavage system aminomethyltransferase GcvT [Acidobacteriota bacterium]
MSAPVEAAVLKRTPLYSLHRELGAKLIDFGGWEMPVQYTGILEEHRAVRERAGIFDVSHMGELEVRGPGALGSLQTLTPNDVSRLADGRCHYSAFLTEDGTFVDDLLVYRRAPDDFLVVVNASNTPKDFDWAAGRVGGAASVVNRSDEYALLAVQGPLAGDLVARAFGDDPRDLAYYAFRTMPILGHPVLVSRTGYTGEDGFELYLSPEAAEPVMRRLLELGREEGVMPCGLGARDTLRLEAKMALYGNDIDDTVTPWEADLGWIVKMEKGDFVGRDALARQKAAGVTRKLAGFEMVDRGIARHGYPARAPHGPGVVTSGTHSPTLGRPIGLAMLPVADTPPGTEFEAEIRGRAARARVVPTPFYKRTKKEVSP